MDTFDKELIAGILSQDIRLQRQAVQDVYEMSFARIKRMIINLGGNLQLAEDAFQEGMVILYQNLKHEKFREASSLHTYLSNICRYRFYHLISKEGKSVSLSPEYDAVDEDQLVPLIDPGLVGQIMNMLKNECRKLLSLYYYEKMSMDEIASAFGLGSAQAARNKKVRCMKSLIEFINKQKLTREAFTTSS